jgi:type II secretory pathway pseudopilin PulG
MRSGKPRGSCGGHALVALLILVALLGFALLGASELWSRADQRERERDLLFVGGEIRAAIGLYYHRTPGPVKRFPGRLEDLLRDDRYPNVIRHLRRIYNDPLTGQPGWGIVEAPGGGIMGVYSRSTRPPLKRAGFAPENKAFEGAASYDEWRFVYNPEAVRTR